MSFFFILVKYCFLTASKPLILLTFLNKCRKNTRTSVKDVVLPLISLPMRMTSPRSIVLPLRSSVMTFPSGTRIIPYCSRCRFQNRCPCQNCRSSSSRRGVRCAQFVSRLFIDLQYRCLLFYVYTAVSINRCKMAATSARVAVSFGAKLPFSRPVMIPASWQ